MRSCSVSIALLLLTGCSQQAETPDATVAKPDTVAHLVVQEGKGLLFSFYDNRAEMRTVDAIDQVARTARSDVMVTNPAAHLPGDLVYVTDLRNKSNSGQYRVWVEPRGTWLDRVVPKQSVSEALARNDPPPKPKRRIRRRRPRRRRRPPPSPAQPQPEPAAKAPAQNAPQVILFSTAWCPSCRAAKAYLIKKRVQFQELDVERDARAAQFYNSIQQRFRLKRGVVPVLVIGQRVFQGFSRPQIDAALAAIGHG